jgi:hypothetical protein
MTLDGLESFIVQGLKRNVVYREGLQTSKGSGISLQLIILKEAVQKYPPKS